MAFADDVTSEEIVALLDAFTSVEIDGSSIRHFDSEECEMRYAVDCKSSYPEGNDALTLNGGRGALTETKIPENGNISIWTKFFNCKDMGSAVKDHDYRWDYLD